MGLLHRFANLGGVDNYHKVQLLSQPASSHSQIESVDLGDKNKVQGLDRSGKSDLGSWRMWCMPNYRRHGTRPG